MPDTSKNLLYVVDELMGRLGKNLIEKLGPKLGFYCEFFYPQERPQSIYPTSGSYVEYRQQPDDTGWMFIAGLIQPDKARVGNSTNDPGTTDTEKRGIYNKLLPLGTKVRVHIPGGRISELKVTRVVQDASRTRSFFVHILEPIL